MFDVTAPGRALYRRFSDLGNLTGKTSSEIISEVGAPTSISSLAHGQTLLQWQATGCHMALIFDSDNRFVKFSHQHYAPQEPNFSRSVYVPPPQPSNTVRVVGTILGLLVGLSLLITQCN